MPEARQRSEETVRVVETGRVAAKEESASLQDLERRVATLQNDVNQLAHIAASNPPRSNLDAGFVRVSPPAFFGALGPVPAFPSLLPQGPTLSGLRPFAASAANEIVSAREFSNLASVTRQPGVNIVDTGEEYVVQVELPGVKKKDLELLGSERAITVTARVRTEPPDDVEGTVLLAECAPTVYRRTINLPSLCNTTRSKAALKDGWLTMNVPKKDASSAVRRIDVAYG